MANQYPTKTVSTNSVGLKTTTLFSYALPVVAKTASYSVQASDSGTIFTTDAATGAVTFTLPAIQAGLSFRFCATAAQNLVVSSPAGTGSIKGSNASSTGAGPSTAISASVLTCAAGTAGNQYSMLSLECNGTVWLVSNLQGLFTITTA